MVMAPFIILPLDQDTKWSESHISNPCLHLYDYLALFLRALPVNGNYLGDHYASCVDGALFLT